MCGVENLGAAHEVDITKCTYGKPRARQLHGVPSRGSYMVSHCSLEVITP